VRKHKENITKIVNELESLDSETTLLLLVPNSFLFGNIYLELRKKLLQNYNLFAIVELIKVFPHSGIKTSILFINKQNKSRYIQAKAVTKLFDKDSKNSEIRSPVKLFCGDSLFQVCGNSYQETDLGRYEELNIDNMFDISNIIKRKQLDHSILRETIKNEGSYRLEFDFISKYEKIIENLTLTGQETYLKDISKIYTSNRSGAKKGDLVIHRIVGSFSRFNIEILEEDTSKSNYLIIKLNEDKFPKNCLISYLLKKRVRDYIELYARNNTFYSLSIQSLENLPIIIDKSIDNCSDIFEGELELGNQHNEILNKFLYEFLKTKDSKLYFSAIAVAGAMLETLFHQYILVDLGKYNESLDKKTLGELFTVIEKSNTLEDRFKDKLKDFIEHRNYIHINKIKGSSSSIKDIYTDLEAKVNDFTKLINDFPIHQL
jgi:hypothetical protein